MKLVIQMEEKKVVLTEKDRSSNVKEQYDSWLVFALYKIDRMQALNVIDESNADVLRKLCNMRVEVDHKIIEETRKEMESFNSSKRYDSVTLPKLREDIKKIEKRLKAYHLFPLGLEFEKIVDDMIMNDVKNENKEEMDGKKL